MTNYFAPFWDFYWTCLLPTENPGSIFSFENAQPVLASNSSESKSAHSFLALKWIDY